jgi:hypothetical protein
MPFIMLEKFAGGASQRIRIGVKEASGRQELLPAVTECRVPPTLLGLL